MKLDEMHSKYCPFTHNRCKAQKDMMYCSMLLDYNIEYVCLLKAAIPPNGETALTTK